jgi:putative flippase GtrA
MQVPRAQDEERGKGTTLRSAAVGASATLLDLAVLATLVHACEVGPRIASPFALLVGVTAQFLGNKLFAFRDRSPRWGRQAAAFAVVEVGAFTLNALGFDALVATTGLHAVPARLLVSACVYFLFCLPLWSRVFSACSEVEPARVG